MEPKNIGYIILEGDNTSSPESTKIIKVENSGRVFCNAIFQSDLDKLNRNNRRYDPQELQLQLTCPRTVELIQARALRSEQGHPLDKSLERQTVIWESNCSCIILDLHMEGFNVVGSYTNTSNEKGKALAEEIREVGYKPAFSLRALGSLQQTKEGALVKGVRLICYDEVVYPSHKNAYTTQVLAKDPTQIASESTIVTESSQIVVPEYAGEVVPILTEDVINYIQSESSNLKFVRECFDFMYNDIKVNDKGSSVILTTKEGDIMSINLEQFIHRELMDYAQSRL